MGEVQLTLTVFFEEPFWVGVMERQEDGRLSVFRTVFGAEPKDHEVYEFILKHWGDLQFSPAVAAAAQPSKANPKKLRREIGRQLQQKGVGTKSQQALKLQQEQNKQERRVKKRDRDRAEAERMFELKQQKKKEKHRGR